MTASARTSSSRCAKAATPSCPYPKLLYPAIQVNIRAGRLPPAGANGRRYLVIPLEGETAA